MVPRLVVLVILFVSQIATAQEVPAVAAKAPTPAGKAIRFEINGLNLRGINGGVGGKWWTSPNVALTATVGFWNKNRTEDAVDDPQQESREFVDSSVMMTLGLEQHMHWSSRLSPYVGLFLGSGLSWLEATRTFHTQEDIIRQKERSTTFSVVAGVSLGVEYFLAENVSVAGQHEFFFDRSSGTRESTQYGASTEIDLSSFKVGFDTSGLILSVYF